MNKVEKEYFREFALPIEKKRCSISIKIQQTMTKLKQNCCSVHGVERIRLDGGIMRTSNSRPVQLLSLTDSVE